ncbi:MAG: CocE/NonD family hydrolase [Gemmatimonadetes bacterium]|nr:CocE/NonD family hydrolase [Gemmatimonadota bacterium]
MHEPEGKRAPRRLALALTLELACIPAAAATASAQVPQRFDVRMPMRDGVELSADMWMPADTGRYPTVLVRTPYIKSSGRYPRLGRFYARRGYVFVVQDARGRGDSQGSFDFFFADARDGYDTVEWIAAQPWSNGRVGMVGGSYLATVQWLAAREQPPHLVCIIPQAPAGRYFDEIPYMGGAFQMEWALRWINGTSARVAQGASLSQTEWTRVYQHRPLLTMDEAMGRKMPLYRDFLTHKTADAYWERILFTTEDFQKIAIPAFTFTGWFDADQPGAISYWEGMRKHSPARDRQYLIAGPWTHGGAIRGGSLTVGDMEFTPSSIVDVDSLHVAFFEYCLKGARPAFDFPRARVYVSGSNVWRSLDDYPPPQMVYRKLYLHSGGAANTLAGDGTLSWEAPGSEPPDRYAYDPQRPVPSDVGGEHLGIDQRVIERRDDVLVYTSEVLEEPLEIIGRVFVVVHAASDARDTDFMAKIMDVYPDGRALKLGPWQAGVLRARYRKGYRSEVLLTANRPEEYRIELFDIGHAFLPGHRVRIEVSSSAHPYIAPNPNTGNPVATDTEWRIARQTVYHDRARASHLLLPMMPATPKD